MCQFFSAVWHYISCLPTYLLYMLVGFSQLALADQMKLLQKTWLDILYLNFAYRSSAEPGTLVFSKDFKVPVSIFRPHRVRGMA